jgi:DNA polymerase-3 subunit epsilon
MTIDFVAIDFETANMMRGSACAIGLAVVEDGKIVETFSQLMRPPLSDGPEAFDDFNVGIHGITWDLVKNEPEFIDVWRSAVEVIGTRPLIAHNAAFDMGVLREALDLSMSDWPTLNYACTLVASRRVLSLPSYSLPYVASELNVLLKQHHDAKSDAVAAAEIMIELCKRKSANSLEELLASINVNWGMISEGNWRGSVAKQKYTSKELPAPRADANSDHFLFGKHIVITGALPSGITRSQAQERIAYFGGIPQENVTKETSLLVIGDVDPHKLAPGATESAKMKKAFKLQSSGQLIEVITGMDFLPLLD